jgi:hypothetical protein
MLSLFEKIWVRVWERAALETYCSLRVHQRNYSDAESFAEEFYNLVVEAYDPVHPEDFRKLLGY